MAQVRHKAADGVPVLGRQSLILGPKSTVASNRGSCMQPDLSEKHANGDDPRFGTAVREMNELETIKARQMLGGEGTATETGEELTPEDSAVFASAREEHEDEELRTGNKEENKELQRSSGRQEKDAIVPQPIKESMANIGGVVRPSYLLSASSSSS